MKKLELRQMIKEELKKKNLLRENRASDLLKKAYDNTMDVLGHLDSISSELSKQDYVKFYKSWDDVEKGFKILISIAKIFK